MSSCCTPEYIKIPSVAISGDLIIKRGTGDAPSCGYYEYYSGTSGLGFYDYYEVNVEYNSGSGFWTFSGNSTGFDDDTVYRSVKTGNPCDPLGSYIGGFYDVVIEEGNKWNVYDFDPVFITAAEGAGIAIGSGIHTSKGVTFAFAFLDPKRRRIQSSKQLQQSPFFEGIVYDIIDTNGATIYQNYFSGYKSTITIDEKENIRLFGNYKKDFGVRATLRDPILGEVSKSELYAYGNDLYIDSLYVADNDGTTIWNTSSDTEQAQTTGVIPSGFIKDKPKIKFKTSFFKPKKHISLSHLNVYASEQEDFETSDSTFIKQIRLDENASFKEFFIEENLKIKPNKDYYFGLKGYSKIGNGNTVKFGPHKIIKKEERDLSSATAEVEMSYKGSTSLKSFKTGNLTADIISGSGLIDTLIINKDDYNAIQEFHKDGEYLYSTIATDPSGKWKYTTFDYLLEFKKNNDVYQNTSKHIKLVATGTSLEPLNSGLPLFEIIDYDATSPVDTSIIYNESGMYLTASTGQQYDQFKYDKTSI